MGLQIEGQYYKKSRDAGPYVPPHIPTEAFKKGYENIRWDKDEDKPSTENEKP